MAATCSRILSQTEHTPKLESRNPNLIVVRPGHRLRQSERPRKELGVKNMGSERWEHFIFISFDPMFLTEIFVGGLSNTSGFVIRISDFGLRATVCLRDNKL